MSAEKATELQAQLNTLAVSLFQTLTHLGQILEAETIPTKEEFTHCIREMPPMDIATLYVGLRRSFLLLLNKQIAEYQVEKSLQQQIGNTVTETLAKAIYSTGTGARPRRLKYVLGRLPENGATHRSDEAVKIDLR
ncbi:MAG: hypothetical protein OHK0047_37040 [Leptolyngbyaceae cyanobacterium]